MLLGSRLLSGDREVWGRDNVVGPLFCRGGGVTPCPSLCLLVVGGDWERASGQLATPVDPRDPEI